MYHSIVKSAPATWVLEALGVGVGVVVLVGVGVGLAGTGVLVGVGVGEGHGVHAPVKSAIVPVVDLVLA